MIENPSISINYALTYKDFVAGQKLAARHNLFLMFFHIFVRYIAVSIAVVLALMCIVNIVSGHGSTVPGVLPLVFLVSLIPAVLWVSWRYSFSQLKLDKEHDPEMCFQADETSFSRQIAGMGDLTWLWSATTGVASNKQVVLISVRRGAFLFIPRSAITDEQITQLEGFLQHSRVVPVC